MDFLNFHGIGLFLGWVVLACKGDQATIDYLATNINLEYHVLDNLNSGGTFDGLLVLENTGPQNIIDLTWSLYFTSIKTFEPGNIRPDGANLSDTGFTVHFINGYLHKIEPLTIFPGFTPGIRIEVPFSGFGSQVEATETMPNWYFTAVDAEPRVLASTAGESLSFVGEFNTSEQWTRGPLDQYQPFTGETRLAHQNYSDLGSAQAWVIPTPSEEVLDPDNTVNIGTGDWVVVYSTTEVKSEAEFLAEKLGTIAVDVEFTPGSRYILVGLGEVRGQTNVTITEQESYHLEVKVTEQIINITGTDTDGVFNGIQTLISLNSNNGEIPHGYVLDYPRFHYRGMHLDVARNFRSKEDVMKLLEVMSMYKMNRFHLHLTDDEGWRLEIPGIPELTQIGARRCHDLSGDLCLLPQLGSVPGLANDGTGYYTIQDYREILQYAATRHIQVIPEIDMPGHCNAAVKSMLARYRKYMDINMTAATEYLLTDLNDTSDYISVQSFVNNSANPCIQSTYNFIQHVLGELKKVHQGIQELTIFNFGGDEVPSGAWEGSPACSAISQDKDELMSYFVSRVDELAQFADLDLAGWEDAFLWSRDEALNRSSLSNDEIYAYAWSNQFEWGNGKKAYVLANAGYRVIISSSTHLYFCHPYEPDPYDWGHYWGPRVVSTRKIFNFQPESIYSNIDVDSYGRPVDPVEICERYGCPSLDPDMEDNIIGMQGHLWTEMARKAENMEDMVFPKLLALAERAWHRADWENTGPGKADMRDDKTEMETQDWEKFANTLGYKEFSRLDQLGVHYRITPPGAMIDPGNVLVAMSEYPGLPIQYSTDNGGTWSDYTEGLVMPPGTVQLITRSADRSRSSRLVELVVPQNRIKNNAVSLLPSKFMLAQYIYIISAILLNLSVT